MFNLFGGKKKDKDYKLDEYKLPSISQSGSGNDNSQVQNNSMGSLPPSNNNSQSNNMMNPNSLPSPNNQSNPMSNSNPFSSINSQVSSPFPEPVSPPTYDNQQSSNPMQAPQHQSQMTSSRVSSNQNNLFDVNPSSLHDEVSRVKIDSIESKVQLMDAKISNVDNKLNLILKILENEISDETKKRLRLDEMVDSFKKKTQN